MKKSFKKEIFLILCILLVSLFACVFDTSDDERTTNTTTPTSNTLKLSGSSWIDTHTQASGYIYKDTFSFNSDGTFLQHKYVIRPGLASSYYINTGTWTNDESSSPMSYIIKYTCNQKDYKTDGSVVTVPPADRNDTFYYKIENSKLYIVNIQSYSSIADLNNTEYVSTNTTNTSGGSSSSNESVGTWMLYAINPPMYDTITLTFNADLTYIQKRSYVDDCPILIAITNGTYILDSNASPKKLDLTFASSQDINTTTKKVDTTYSSGTINYYYKIENSKLYLKKTSEYSLPEDLDNTSFVLIKQ